MAETSAPKSRLASEEEVFFACYSRRTAAIGVEGPHRLWSPATSGSEKVAFLRARRLIECQGTDRLQDRIAEIESCQLFQSRMEHYGVGAHEYTIHIVAYGDISEVPDLWQQVQNDQAALEDREPALSKLLQQEDPRLPAFVASELSKNSLSPSWRDALIVAAEHLTFTDQRTRGSLSSSLLRWALLMRDEGGNVEHVVWAALRKYASLVEIGEAKHLAMFLRAEDRNGVRQTALQAIQSIFHAAPPSVELREGELRGLHERVGQLAKKYLDPDWLSPGENSALASNAICALASLAHERVIDCIHLLPTFAKPRLSRRITHFVQQLERAWRAANFAEADLMREVLQLLRQP